MKQNACMHHLIIRLGLVALAVCLSQEYAKTRIALAVLDRRHVLVMQRRHNQSHVALCVGGFHARSSSGIGGYEKDAEAKKRQRGRDSFVNEQSLDIALIDRRHCDTNHD